MVYVFTGRQDDMDLFRLEQTTGRIYTKEPLDREKKDYHLLCVETFAPGRESGRRTRATKDEMILDIRDRTNHDSVLYILVEVQDANDKGPEFVKKMDTKGLYVHLFPADTAFRAQLFKASLA